LSSAQASLGPEAAHGRKVHLRAENHEEVITAKLVIAANGLGSRLLLDEPGCAVRSAPESRVGAGVVAEIAPEFYQDGVVYMAYGTGGYVGLVRLEDGRLNIAAALDVGPLRAAHNPGSAAAKVLDEIGWPAIPGLCDLDWHGTPTLTRQPARPAGTRVFAVGDAAGYVEPFTGEGIGWAMASGAAVVSVATRAVHSWHPSLADEWASIQGRAAHSRRLCRAMTWVSRRPMLARAMIGAVAQLPWLAGPLVSQVGRASRNPRLAENRPINLSQPLA
jgi:flavin-dependent dehydrogenase